MQSLDNSPDVGLVGGAWMGLESCILMSHLAGVAFSDCACSRVALVRGSGEGSEGRKRPWPARSTQGTHDV